MAALKTQKKNNASVQESDWMLAGFSNRKNCISLYIMGGFLRYEPLLKKFGEHKTGKSCLCIKSLNEINTEVLKKLISSLAAYMKENYETE